MMKIKGKILCLIGNAKCYSFISSSEVHMTTIIFNEFYPLAMHFAHIQHKVLFFVK
jgi:hypothetical protein